MEEVSVHTLVEKSKNDPGIITVETTVLTGFEFMAFDECKEKCSAEDITKAQGRIFFNIPIGDFEKVKKLRSVDNVYLVSASVPKIEFRSDKEKDLEVLKDLVDRVDWHKCLESWATLRQFMGVMFPNEGGGGGGGDGAGEIIKYRVTCNRVGSEHSFTSMEAAAHFGGVLNDKFGWAVDLTGYHLEVVLNISSDAVYVCAALTSESMHKRNITHFSSTTLRATMCYNLLRLAKPQPGDIVIDPMAGGGSIPIEGCLGLGGSYYVGGDSDEKAVNRSNSNVGYLKKQTGHSLPMDIIRWDFTRLPLTDQSIDVIVTDLPFGKRSGKKKDNRWLYKSALFEMARVARVNSARAVLLTADKKAIIQAFGSKGEHPYWKKARSFTVNQGGLNAIVFLLYRNSKVYTRL